MGFSRRWFSLLVVAAMALSACSDSEGRDKIEARPSLLDRTPQLIVADALSDVPSREFLAVRSRVASGVTKERREYTRGFVIAGGRGPALVSDITISTARRETAIALGVNLDPIKEVDANLANASIDALLAELQKRVAGATSCQAAGVKADDCAVALLLLEVKRSEAPPAFDGGVSVPDSGTGAPDSGIVTAPDSAAPSDGGSDAGSDAGPIVAGPVTPIECGARDTTGAREVMGSISASETWSGKIVVKGDVQVRGGTLTIAPGTEIFMEADSSLVIGWNNAEAAIIADGTLAAPIRICGKSPDRGFWSSITVESNVTSNSVLRNVLISDGAGETTAALALAADLTIDNVQVRNAQHSGVLAVDFKEGSRQLSVDGTTGQTVVLTGPGAITRFPLGGYFRTNTENLARVRLSYIDVDTVVHSLGIAYLQETDVYTRMGTLTFEAGVDYRFQPDTILEVGWNNGSAGIQVMGTAAAPVVFRAASDVSASWSGIHVNSSVLTNSNLTYAEIRQAGSGSSFALQVDAPVKVDHVTLRGNARGMKVGTSGVAASSTALTITETQSEPLVVEADGVYGLPTGGAYTGNMSDQIRIQGNTISKSGTIADLGVPYLVAATLYIGGGVNMVIAPGTDFLMGSGVDLHIGWNNGDVTFTANGTAAAPIRFTGLSASPGFWGSLIVEGNVRPASSFNYVQLGHGGQTATAMLDLEANVPVMNSRFFDSAGYGIAKRMANPTDYALTNTFENTASGTVQVK